MARFGDLRSAEIVDLAEADVNEGFLLPDELEELCRVVLDLVEGYGARRT